MKKWWWACLNLDFIHFLWKQLSHIGFLHYSTSFSNMGFYTRGLQLVALREKVFVNGKWEHSIPLIPHPISICVNQGSPPPVDSGVLEEGDIYNMQVGSLRGLELVTSGLNSGYHPYIYIYMNQSRHLVNVQDQFDSYRPKRCGNAILREKITIPLPANAGG